MALLAREVRSDWWQARRSVSPADPTARADVAHRGPEGSPWRRAWALDAAPSSRSGPTGPTSHAGRGWPDRPGDEAEAGGGTPAAPASGLGMVPGRLRGGDGVPRRGVDDAAARIRVPAWTARRTTPGARAASSPPSPPRPRAHAVLRRIPVRPLPWPAAPIGLAMQATGLGLRAWSMQTLRESYTRTLRVSNEQEVVDRGPLPSPPAPGLSGVSPRLDRLRVVVVQPPGYRGRRRARWYRPTCAEFRPRRRCWSESSTATPPIGDGPRGCCRRSGRTRAVLRPSRPPPPTTSACGGQTFLAQLVRGPHRPPEPGRPGPRPNRGARRRARDSGQHRAVQVRADHPSVHGPLRTVAVAHAETTRANGEVPPPTFVRPPWFSKPVSVGTSRAPSAVSASAVTSPTARGPSPLTVVTSSSPRPSWPRPPGPGSSGPPPGSPRTRRGPPLPRRPAAPASRRSPAPGPP